MSAVLQYYNINIAEMILLRIQVGYPGMAGGVANCCGVPVPLSHQSAHTT